MKNKNFLLTMTLSLLTSIILVGCGTQAAAEPTPIQAPPTEPAPVSTETAESLVTDVPNESLTDVPIEPPTEVPMEAPAAEVATVSFSNDIMPIIQSRCINCHGGDRIEEGLLMRTYDEILAGSDNGPVIVPGDVTTSLLVELITTKEMPKKGPKLTPPQIQAITEWVAAGAPNN